MLTFRVFFFFNDTATTEIYTLSLHDALPIYGHAARRARAPDAVQGQGAAPGERAGGALELPRAPGRRRAPRSEEHTSELQSQSNLVCRLLLEKKKKQMNARVTKNRAGDRSMR